MLAAVSRPDPTEESDRRERIAELRQLIARSAWHGPEPMPTGSPLDAILPQGGLPRGAITEMHGPIGAGRMRVALLALIGAAKSGRGAVVDPMAMFYPPAAAALGMPLERMLLVRPRDPARAAWAAEQIARSGVAICVVVIDARVDDAHARRLLRAAETGQTALVLLAERPTGLPVALSLNVMPRGGEIVVEVMRSRMGFLGAKAIVAPIVAPPLDDRATLPRPEPVAGIAIELRPPRTGEVGSGR